MRAHSPLEFSQTVAVGLTLLSRKVDPLILRGSQLREFIFIIIGYIYILIVSSQTTGASPLTAVYHLRQKETEGKEVHFTPGHGSGRLCIYIYLK